MSTRKLVALLLLALAAAAGVACRPHVEARAEHNQQPASKAIPQPIITTISIGPQVLRTGVERFGINLSGQSFYDSGQMLRNLVSRNPGFEGEIWQSILRCKIVTPTSCTEENQYTQWPTGFLSGARFEILSGAAKGLSGTVDSSTAAAPPNGITLRFAALTRPLHTGDFILVQRNPIAKPGDPTAGWWTEVHNGAAFTAEAHDLPPHASGRQALRVEASAPSQSAMLTSYFDSLEGHSFVQLHGSYEIRFRAKPTGGAGQVAINLTRLDTVHGRSEFFNKGVKLTSGWHDYVFPFEAHEDGRAVGTVGLQFIVNGSSVLLDDVSLASTAPSPAPAFRPEVVEALRNLHPGLLRYMDSGAGFGSSLDNLLQPQFARQRAGYNTQNLRQEDIPIGLEDFLELCAAIDADPWITLPPGLSPAEGSALIDFLTGPATSLYGSKRAALGHAAPWSQGFHTIHLELGNEQWNSRSFAGGTIHDPIAYAQRASAVFTAMRRAPGFNQAHFDLIAGTWNAVPWWTGQELAGNPNADTLAIAPYLFSEFNDATSAEAVYGPMLAQPEQLDSRPTGLVSQQAAQIATQPHKSPRPTHLAVYEVNLGVMSGTATQVQLDRAIPSWGGGLAVADHMLLMLRDQGITTQALFCLPEFRNPFTNTTGGGNETVPLWGSVVDMGGNTNRKRPTYLALQALNSALLPTMLQTSITGPNPTWDQPLSRNDKIELSGAHELQTFAFADGDRRSLILLNLSRTQAHTVQLASPPTGPVEQTVISPPHLSDGNEQANTVRATNATLPANKTREPLTLPPGSLTVLRWRAAPQSLR